MKNNMKGKLIWILPVIAVLILSSGIAEAQISPAPILAKVISDQYAGSIQVTMKNLETLDIVSGKTIDAGEFSYDWANSCVSPGRCYSYGDRIEITILDQVKVRRLSRGGDIVYFNFLPEEIPPVPEPIQCPAYPSCQACQSAVELCTPLYCQGILGTSEGNPPSTESLPVAVLVLTHILTGAGGFALYFGLFNNKIFTGLRTGMKQYRGRDGELKIYHKHPGIKGYHNPKRVHRKPENHPMGMVDVKNGYKKDKEGKWYYE